MKRWKHQNGSNLVEMALVSPLLLLLVFGIVDFSLALYNKAVITNAAREGARAGMALRTPRLSDGEITTVVTTYCQNHLITFASETIPSVTVTKATDLTGGEKITVYVSYTYNYGAVMAFIPGLGNTLALDATSVMRSE